MNNTLVFLWGLVKDDTSKVVSNIKNMLETTNVDFGISTWENQHFDESLFKYVLKHKEPTQEYLDSINFPTTIQCKGKETHRYLRLGQYSQFYHQFVIYDFICKNNLSYDSLIKMRADLMFKTDFKIDFTKEICYIPITYHKSKGIGVNDHFMAGNLNLMKKAMYIGDFKNIYPIIENSWNPEVALQTLLHKNSITYGNFPCSSYILLPNRIFQ